MPFQRWISVSVNKRLDFILKQSLSFIDRGAELSNLFNTSRVNDEWMNSYNDTVIIIKHTSLDFTSFWTSAWLCKSCQQVNCQLCFWQNCDSSGRQSALQSDALRLNAPSTSFLVQITTLNSRNGPLLLFPVLNWYWTRAVAHLTHSRWTLIEQWRAI